MTTYNTGNPVPSGDARDRFDNTQTLDELLNTSALVALSRLGMPLKTWAGILKQVTDYLLAQGYEATYLIYGAGVVIQRQTQLVQRSGELYRVMNASDLPLTLTGTWATDAPKLLAVGDAALRQALALPTGAAMVGTSRGNTAEFELTDYAAAMGRTGLFDRFAQGGPCDILMVGDSNSAGAGSSGGFVTGFMARFARSIMNAFDKYPGTDRGYMYYTWLNAYQQLLSEGGWSQGGGGSAVAGGPGGNAWRLPAGAWVEKTGIEVSQGRVFYAPSTDGSVLSVTVNGSPAGTFTVSSSGFTANFNLAAGGAYIKPTDIIRITCTSGSVDAYGFRFMRAGGSRGPIVYCSPEGSQSFSDYSNPTRANLLGAYVNADQPTAPKLVMAFLGTNNMITAAGKNKTPAAMVADMQTFVNTYRALFPGCVIVFWTPLRPGPTATMPDGTYDQYVRAIVDFVATQTSVGLFRTDLSGLNGQPIYASPDPVPDVHLNDYGHPAVAKYCCDYLGIAVDIGNPQFAAAVSLPPRIAISPGANWTSAATTRALNVAVGGEVGIYGTMTKGAGGTVAVGQVSVTYTPIEDTFFAVPDQAGVMRTLKLTASNRSISIVDAAALSSITALNFSGQGYRT